jgi:hypothetical protein
MHNCDDQDKPEKGSTLRNRLVSLLTSADQDVTTMTAEFLFVICKHNVGRLVKHTGQYTRDFRKLGGGGRAQGLERVACSVSDPYSFDTDPDPVF